MPGSFITLTITGNALLKDGRGNFEIDDLPQLLSAKEFQDYLQEMTKLRAVKSIGNFSKLYDMTIIDKAGFELKIKFYMQRAKSPLVRARFRSKRGAINKYDFQPYLKKHYKVGDKLRLEKIGPKTFRIV